MKDIEKIADGDGYYWYNDRNVMRNHNEIIEIVGTNVYFMGSDLVLSLNACKGQLIAKIVPYG
ncbi:hypothetical protein LCGC14_1524430 [marine sediment metagenome]|uniref:Uncharacterized protein n=1 Tax=marine sediment metagenome TaxID=412755 RepID=A0A0F9IXT6_9ZZZZ